MTILEYIFGFLFIIGILLTTAGVLSSVDLFRGR